MLLQRRLRGEEALDVLLLAGLALLGLLGLGAHVLGLGLLVEVDPLRAVELSNNRERMVY